MNPNNENWIEGTEVEFSRVAVFRIWLRRFIRTLRRKQQPDDGEFRWREE